MKNKFPYKHRDLSWLSFNYRVLQEAKDTTLPILERLKFLAIYSNNLGEFFRVRVAAIRNLIRLGKEARKALDFSPRATLQEIQSILKKQQIEFSTIFEQQILPMLSKQGICIRQFRQLNEEQLKFVKQYYQDNKKRFGRPIILKKQNIRPSLLNASLYLAVRLAKFDSSLADYALYYVPSNLLPRFIELPASKADCHEVILLDDILRCVIDDWGTQRGYQSIEAYSMKLTRDAELYIDDEFSGNLVEKIQRSLAKRQLGPTSRFVYDRKMPADLLLFLKECLHLVDWDLFAEGRYHNNFDFFKFPDFGLKHLKLKPLPPLKYQALDTPTLFERLATKDYLLNYPFHAYEPVIQFFEQAALDPKVETIKIVQYRVASTSRIMEALIRAARNGKHVLAFVEIKARFDEEANLIWAKRLQAAGVTVLFSFPGLKVHAKLALVERREQGELQRYTYLSTGNFHEKTAKVYSDFGLFTVNEQITTEVAQVFRYLETQEKPAHPFKTLLVGQFNLRPNLTALIEREIQNALLGKPAHIIIKVNSLEDKKIIKKLYKASQAGVKIQLIVRGLCCLVPYIADVSDNIEVISIVDRFLEHSRVFIFHNQGQNDIYLSSADTMERNLSRRIEVAFPIYDPFIKAIIQQLIDLQLKDTVKARIIDQADTNQFQQGEPKIQSQLATYAFWEKC